MSKVLVCGSRDWKDRDAIADALAELAGLSDVEILHGDAAGADRMAGQIAKTYGFAVRVFPAEWKTHGKRAGLLRNLAMLDEDPNLVLAFQRNGSRGTQHTIDQARKRGISVQVFRPAQRNGEPATARRFSIQSHGGTREHPERSD